jgi:hypothetical protein
MCLSPARRRNRSGKKWGRPRPPAFPPPPTRWRWHRLPNCRSDRRGNACDRRPMGSRWTSGPSLRKTYRWLPMNKRTRHSMSCRPRCGDAGDRVRDAAESGITTTAGAGQRTRTGSEGDGQRPPEDAAGRAHLQLQRPDDVRPEHLRRRELLYLQHLHDLRLHVRRAAGRRVRELLLIRSGPNGHTKPPRRVRGGLSARGIGRRPNGAAMDLPSGEA